MKDELTEKTPPLPEKNKDLTFGDVYFWVMGIVFAISAVRYLFSFELLSMLFMVAGVFLALPPVYDRAIKKSVNLSGGIRFVGTIGLIYLSSVNLSPASRRQLAHESSTPKSEPRFLEQMIKSNKAFPPMSYAQGQIPAGTYVFMSERGGYFEEGLNGEIHANNNFSSFGYVQVNGVGNITTRGYLINLEFFKESGFETPLAMYEKITNQSDYSLSGMYKVGLDIPPGRYLVTSLGTAYVSINKGPVGREEIIENDNFQGSKIFNVRAGNYLNIQRSKFTKTK